MSKSLVLLVAFHARWGGNAMAVLCDARPGDWRGIVGLSIVNLVLVRRWLRWIARVASVGKRVPGMIRRAGSVSCLTGWLSSCLDGAACWSGVTVVSGVCV